MVTPAEMYNAVLQVLVAFAIIAVIVRPRTVRGFAFSLALAAILETAVDGVAYFFGKMLTHNLTVLVELPLMLIFAGVVMDSGAVKKAGLLVGPVNLYFLLQDGALEGDVLYVMYPFDKTPFVWNSSLVFPMGGVEVSVTFLLIVALLVYIGISALAFGRGGTAPHLHLPITPSHASC